MSSTIRNPLTVILIGDVDTRFRQPLIRAVGAFFHVGVMWALLHLAPDFHPFLLKSIRRLRGRGKFPSTSDRSQPFMVGPHFLLNSTRDTRGALATGRHWPNLRFDSTKSLFPVFKVAREFSKMVVLSCTVTTLVYEGIAILLSYAMSCGMLERF